MIWLVFAFIMGTVYGVFIMIIGSVLSDRWHPDGGRDDR